MGARAMQTRKGTERAPNTGGNFYAATKRRHHLPCHEKCVPRVGAGPEVIAPFLQEMNETGDLFRPGVSG
jgi:hypothetical protein